MDRNKNSLACKKVMYVVALLSCLSGCHPCPHIFSFPARKFRVLGERIAEGNELAAASPSNKEGGWGGGQGCRWLKHRAGSYCEPRELGEKGMRAFNSLSAEYSTQEGNGRKLMSVDQPTKQRDLQWAGCIWGIELVLQAVVQDWAVFWESPGPCVA